jgi:hypothetical protein
MGASAHQSAGRGLVPYTSLNVASSFFFFFVEARNGGAVEPL